MGWWDPFGAGVFAFAGGPAAGFDGAVVFSAAQGEVIDVGLAIVGPVVDRVVYLAVGPGYNAAGAGTAPIPGQQHDALISGGDAPGAPQIQCAAGVSVENG